MAAGATFFQCGFWFDGGGGNAALIGRGGAGESALLSTVAGVLAPDEGPAVIDKNSGISFLPRNPSFSESGEIRGHIFRGVPDYRGLQCGNKERLALVMGITLPCPKLFGDCGGPENRLREKYRDCRRKDGLSGVAQG